MRAPRRAPPEGRTESFDKYRFVARIGTGGMADVYLAVLHGPEGFQRLLVLKRLRPDLSGDAKYRAMLLDEARLAARLHHPNIVQTLEFGEHEGCPYIAMEYLDGQPLHAMLQSQRSVPGLLDPVLSAIVVSEALAGLHHAHELCDYDGTKLAIVHRDVSPQNVFVTYAGEVKLVDFGIARTALREPDTDVGVVKGKLAYMAPEQARGDPLDRRADVFAMGVVLWELCTQERLFASGGPVTTMEKLVAGHVPPPSSRMAAVDGALDAVCARALAPAPADRYQTAAEMRDAIEDWLRHAHGHGSRRDLVAGRMHDRFAADRARIEQRIQAAMSSARKRWSSGAEDPAATPFLLLAATPADASPDDLTRRDLPRPRAAGPSSTPSPLTPGERLAPPGPEDTSAGAGRRRAFLGTAALGLAVAAGVALGVKALPPPAASSAAPTASVAPTRAPAVLLRLRGSNTVGAALAPALVEAFLRSDGATSVQRTPEPSGRGVLLTARAEDDAPARAIAIASEGSATAFEGLADGSCDIGMASRPIKPDEAARLSRKGLGQMRSAASEHVVALDGIAVVVHPNNPVKSLTREDLRRVFAGDTRDWSALGAPAGPITVDARDDASGTFDMFKLLVLGDRALTPAARRFQDSDELSGAVAAERGAIGFIGVAYVRNARAVAVGDEATPPRLPSAFTVTTEEYLLSRRLYFYTPAQPTNPWILRFVGFALSDAGQKVVREAGFVDLGIELESAESCAGRCPRGYAERVRHARRLSVDFRFREGTLELDSRGVRDVDRLVAFLRGHSGGGLMLLGFSDDRGTVAERTAASRARAAVVAKELAERGVRAEVVEGRGAEMPVASNAEEMGRERNRRVEAWVMEGP